jgi:cytochrome b
MTALPRRVPLVDDVSLPAAPTAPVAPARTRILLWDLPTRIVHWSLVTAVTVAIVTGKVGGNWMVWHGRAGLAIVGLVAFRLVWGVVGSTHARFLSFVPGPKRVVAYLRGRWRGVGHNPLGAFSVLALLALLGVQAGTGLFTNDDIAFAGPLFDLVDEDLAGRLASWHHQIADLLLWLVGLHVVAIVFYLAIKRDNLVKPMVTGWKQAEPEHHARGGGALAFGIALVVAVGAVAVANGIGLGVGLGRPAAVAPAAAADSAASPTAPAASAAQAAPAW